MSVVVRRVGPEAAADVLAVVREAFGARPVLDPPADALGEDLDSIARLLAGRGGLLATIDDAPVGCAVLDVRPDGIVLRRFGVTPRAQGQGVATALVDA
ncbi:GNAT family N-acetyltransferase, partial [Nocardioides sp.]|uniref:GNAT family N-acetyltransferase n=1 Tax=Nocardioides sp. TaxID=35761 RepID=UPI0026302480